jgi:hypothetical protein
MNTSATVNVRQIPVLLRGEPEAINDWIQRWSARRVLLYVAVIILGAALFGAAVGCWRSNLQALYAAIKFPLIILLTTLGNALLNAMLAPLLGLNLGFRQSLLAILMSFTIAAAILGAFSPVVFFMVWNTPPLTQGAASSASAHSLIQLMEVVVIAFAGVAANLRLLQLLRRLSGSAVISRKILFAWLAGNLFLGSQLSWILRPFIGSPVLPVEFLRNNAFQGSFYETVFRSLRYLLF